MLLCKNNKTGELTQFFLYNYNNNNNRILFNHGKNGGFLSLFISPGGLISAKFESDLERLRLLRRLRKIGVPISLL